MNVNKAVLLTLCTFLGFGLSPALAKDLKVGVVDVQSLVANYSEAKKMQERLQEEYKRRDDEVKELQLEVLRLQEDYRKKQSALTAEARQDKETIIRSKAKEADDKQVELTQQFSELQQQLNADLLKDIKEHIDKVADSGGYDLVYDLAAFLYVREGTVTDLTEKILESLENAKKKKK